MTTIARIARTDPSTIYRQTLNRLSDFVEAQPLNAAMFGLKATNTAAQNDAAIAALVAASPAGGADWLFPRGSYDYATTIEPPDGVRIIGEGAPLRWRSSKSGTRLNYKGTGQAVRVRNKAGDDRESVVIQGIRFDGTGLTGTVDGVYIDGTYGTAANYVEGVLLRDVAVTNFPRHQLLLDGLIIDVVCDHVSLTNTANQSGNALARSKQTKGAPNVVTQLSFNECLMAQYGTEASSGAGAWCYHGDAIDVRFVGGTLTTNGQAGGSGIWAQNASLTLIGTHLEGIPALMTGVGVRRSGATPAVIQPAYCASFTHGVQIGDPTAASVAAVDTTVMGMVGGNTTDVRLISGGSRRGTKLLALGESSGSPATVADDRRTTDGAFELTQMSSTGALVMPRVAQAAAPNNSVYTNTGDGRLHFKDADGTTHPLY